MDLRGKLRGQGLEEEGQGQEAVAPEAANPGPPQRPPQQRPPQGRPPEGAKRPGPPPPGAGRRPPAPPPPAAPAPKAAAFGGEGPLSKLLPGVEINRRFLLLAGAAAALAALVAVMYLGSAGAGLEEGGTKVEVVVLREDVRAGMPMNEDTLTTAQVPKAYLPKGSFTDPAKLEGMVAIAPMVAGEPVIAARVSKPDPRYGVAYLLKRGERAKTIAIDGASGLGGLLKPGDEVDLVATIPDPADRDRRISTPVLQKARIIAVGDELLGAIPRRGDDEDRPRSDLAENTMTLAVPARKIELLTLLEDLGNLKVVLRAAGDGSVAGNRFSDDQIMMLVAGKAPPKPRPAAKATPRPVVHHAPPRPVVHHAPPRPAYVPPRPRPQPVAVSRPAPRPVARPRPAPVAAPPRAVQPARPPEIIRFGN